MFVFRNNTVERFFPKGYSFSGYDDISLVPADADGYVWFYQAPLKYDLGMFADEVESYLQKLKIVLGQIDISKEMIALTMTDEYRISFSDDDHRQSMAVSNYNQSLYELSEQYLNLKVIDICDFTEHYSEEDLFDWKYYFISQMGINPRLSKDFAAWWQKKLCGIAMMRKKCLVLDLDNTIWGGILGEDGINGIKIGGDYPGKAFLLFQKGLSELSKTGVILAICSKNNEQDVLDLWEQNPFIILKREDFAAYRINWRDKATNIRELADELNIGLDSMVFLDDSPAERELVRQALPEVVVPDFPEHPYDLPVFFKKLVDEYFKAYRITSEDRQKIQQYRANVERKRLRDSILDYNEYLASLEIKIDILLADDTNIPRIAQLTQKTNQFNLTTRRYTEAEVRQKIAEGWKIWCIAVSDRFGDNGITGCALVNKSFIDSFMLSCRILGKGIEEAFLKKVLEYIKDSGIYFVSAQYVPTAKNGMVKDFYDHCGFVCVNEAAGEKKYQIDLETADLAVADYYKLTSI